jgi:ion channel
MPSLSDFGWFLSPTRKIIDTWKAKRGRAHRTVALRKWSRCLFFFELGALLALSALCREPAQGKWTIVGAPLLLYAISRINEIAYAFYRDPLSPVKDSNLTSVDRIRMAMRSYFGLGFNFSVLYYFAPFPGLFSSGNSTHPLEGFAEAVYFSGVTLATLGYGDIVPACVVSRAVALAEVFTGILVIAVAVAAYVGGIRKREV